MPISMLCAQCGSPAERCARCSGALCPRKLCAELHEAACTALSTMPPRPARVEPTPRKLRPSGDRRRPTTLDRQLVQQLVLTIAQHRADGRAALLIGELDRACTELWSARDLELQLDRLGSAAARSLPDGWELETDLTPLARALSSRSHARAGEAWRRVLDDGPARSIQVEAAEWLARDAFGDGQPRAALRILHASSLLGRQTEAEALRQAYKHAALDPTAAFGLYLTATRLDGGAARAAGLRDPLTDQPWPDQDPRWWRRASLAAPRPGERASDHQAEALSRARDLAHAKREQGWLLLAEGDYLAGPVGARTLGRAVRAGSADPADHDSLVRIRLAYEGAADRLPDVAWPWYRLAELLAWSGFAERAREHLNQADRRTLGGREAERAHRGNLQELVQTALSSVPDHRPSTPRSFPAEPFGANLAWRLRLR